ncbi:hypothetical protein [Paenibacillus chitinolyticus]|uniref:hypothetical protein n=1 Tax=Paenibacillus chitinolyticus TaxID=79263 RepID=UPI003652CB5C
MDITSQEEIMIKALREAALPPLFVLIRIRNDISNDTVNVEKSRRDVVVKTMEKYISPLWKDYHEGKSSKAKEE